MVVEDAQTGFVGAVVRIEYGRMELEDRHGRQQAVPGRPRLSHRRPAGDPHRAATGRSASVAVPRRARWPCPAHARRWRWRAASTSRAATTPNSSSRCGATTCGSRASSSNTSAASTISRRSSRSSGPRPGRRLGVLVDHLVAGLEGGPHRRRGPPRAGRRAHARGRPSVHRHLAGGQAGPARRPAWPVIPKGVDWKHGVCRSAGLAARPAGRHREGMAADPGPGARLERSRAGAHRPGRGTDRLRDVILR